MFVTTSNDIAKRDAIKPFLAKARYASISTNATAKAIGEITANAPKLVATPLPPLNFEKQEKICPNTVANPRTCIARLLSLKTNLPIKAKAIPFAQSSTKVKHPQNLPTDLNIFIVPGLPEPSFFMSLFFIAAIKVAKFMLPTM